MRLSVSLTKNETLWGWIYLIFQLFGLPYILVGAVRLLGLELSNATLNIIMFIVNFAAIALIFHRFLYTSMLQAVEAPLRCLRGAFLGFVIYFLGSLIVGALTQALFPAFVNENDKNILSMVEENYTLMTLCVVFFVPITEEVLYRGLLFGKLYSKNKLLGYGVSALVFSAIHVIGYIGVYEPAYLLVSLLQYVIPSLCLAWAYAYSGNIWSSILMHITINQIGINFAR